MTIHGHIQNGSIVLDDNVTLPEGASVQVRVILPTAVEGKSDPSCGQHPTLLERLGDVVGAIDDLPFDGAKNLDHYLYGAPKKP